MGEAVNRKQRRIAKHRNPYAAAQAGFEQELRKALRAEGVQLVSASTGQDNEGAPTWVLQTKRDSLTWLLRAPNKSVPFMVKAILARMNGETDEIETAQAAITSIQSDAQPPAPPAITANAPAPPAEARHPIAERIERTEKVEEDLSRYLK